MGLGGIIADHIAADAVDAGKISFVEASGENVRADTLQVQAANILGRLTVNALNVTGTITADQVQDKLKAPVRLHEAFSSDGYMMLASNERRTSFTTPELPEDADRLVVPILNTYGPRDMSRLFRYFLIEGVYWMSDTASPNGLGISPSNLYFAKYVPVSLLYNSSGRITNGKSQIDVGQRLLTPHVPGHQWPLWAPVLAEIQTIAVNGGSQAGLTIRIGSNVGIGTYTCRIFGLSGVWKE